VRRRCNKSLRATIHLWANLSRRPLPGPPTITKPSGRGGKSHAGALPCLGQRWLKILSKMWHTRRCYHPDLHTPNQLKHGSWILQLQRA
jgi:hypothetical protein